MRWWVVLCAAGLWDAASLHPTKEINYQHRECCPCPKDSTAESTNTQDSVNLSGDQSSAGSSVSRAVDCPCLRSADSDGAPSMFFPAAVRAIKPFVSLGDSKEDPKPLLHPEVDLASSVLDTLREATNEEYEEALARDAARASQQPDEMAAEPTHNMVAVVMKPKDFSPNDAMSEASHIHDARCISPPVRSSLSLRTPAFRSSDLLSDILRLPKRQPPSFRAWNLFDVDSGVGASNVNEQVVKPNFKESETPKALPLLTVSTSNKPKTTLSFKVPSLFKDSDGLESSNRGAGISNKLRLKTKLELPDISKILPRMDTTNIFRKSGDDLSLNTNTIEPKNSPSTFKLQIPQISTLFPKQESSNLLSEPVENRNSISTLKLNIPKLVPDKGSSNLQNSKYALSETRGRGLQNNLKVDVPNLKATISNKPANDMSDSDSLNFASSIQERYSTFAKSNTDGCNDLGSQTVETKSGLKTPAVNSMNFKNDDSADVDDNTSNKNNGLKLKIPELRLPPSKSRDAATDFLNNLLKGLQIPNLIISPELFNSQNQDLTTKSTEKKEVNEVKLDNPFSTEILDTVPSPSQKQTSHVVVAEKERDDDMSNKINEEMQNMIEALPEKTEILDSLSKSSEITDIDNSEDPEDIEAEVGNNDLINVANQEQQTISFDKDTSELINEIEETDLDNIDDEIDDTSNLLVDRENSAETDGLVFDSVRGSSVEMEDFITENKADESSIDSDTEPLESEKSTSDTTTVGSLETLKPLRERLRQRFKGLNSRPKGLIDFPKQERVDKSSNNQVQINQDAIVGVESSCKEDLVIEKSNENVDQINIDDLQKMSDSLLSQENQRKDADLPKNIDPAITESESSHLNSDVQTTDNVVLETNILDSVDKVNNACIVNDMPNGNVESNEKFDSKNIEMEVGASERVASVTGPEINFASPLRQSIALEPSSFGSDFNLFNPLPVLNIPNFLKAREDINSNNNIFATKKDSIENDFETSNLSAQPSTSNLKLSLPPLQPLEDINLDILQLKPLSVDMPTLPRLNLNSFKTRLSVPNSLDLKPVLLESSVGNNKGVIGATLTLGSGKGLDRSNLMQEASSLRSSNILGQSLGTLPSLADLHESLLENTQNLLSTPLETTGRNVFEDTLRSSQVLTDNLRVQAENTVKDIQQLSSNLRGAGLQSHSGFSSFRSSSDLLEEITRRHEDVNDKLKGISVDLSDRLESLRDNILDQYRIPSLGSSLFGHNSFPSLGSAIPKQSSTFRTYAKPSKDTLKFSTKGKFVTPKTKSSPRTSTKSKLKTASSITSPKAIAFPKLKSLPTEPSIFRASKKDSSLKPLFSREKPTLDILKSNKNLIDFDRPLIKKTRLGQSKVKISFSTTPLPPALKRKSSFGTDLKVSPKPLQIKSTVTKLNAQKDKKLGTKLSSFRDSSGFASEVIPSRVKAPVTDTKLSVSDSNIINSISTTTTPSITLSIGKPKSSLDTPVNRPTKSDEKLQSTDITKIPALSWPKTIDEEFLTKVREAVRARLAEMGKKMAKSASESKLDKLEPSADVDMAKSASNDVVVTGPQIMKENTAYTCKMMCTKN